MTKTNENKFFYKKIITDSMTVLSLFNSLESMSNYRILFESVVGGEAKGRYSIIALLPQDIWRVRDGKVSINGTAEDISKYTNSDKSKTNTGQKESLVFASLRDFVNRLPKFPKDILPKMSSAAFGFMGYDMIREMENIPDNNPSELDIDDAIYFLPQIIIINDNLYDEATICFPFAKNKAEADGLYNKIIDCIKSLSANLVNDIAIQHEPSKKIEIKFTDNETKENYLDIVKKAKEYIKAGDVFQIVPSRRISAPYELHPMKFYRSLRRVNPSPYLFYLNLDNFCVIGSSPEILVRLENDVATIRPLAGTVARGKNDADDEQLSKGLLADEKEKAEHLMLVDLGRNDVGRIADKDSVKVTEMMQIEKYSHVMHIVSNVEGKIKSGKDYIDLLAAGFPAGTVSGAPKIRAMELIDELEGKKRQFYAGTVGYITAYGEIDTAITLRTALIKDKRIYLQAGAGVVYDSDPDKEYEETNKKLGALVLATQKSLS